MNSLYTFEKPIIGITLENWQKAILLSIYPGYDKIIGPYAVTDKKETNNGRYIITLYNSYLPKTDKRKSKTYVFARAVAESYLGYSLPRSLTVDHIDKNYKNNSPENLAIVTMSEHSYYDNKRCTIKPINCPLCNEIFEPLPKQAYPKLDQLGTPGPFCPKCVKSNAYINYINKGGNPIPRAKLIREYSYIEKDYTHQLLSNIVLEQMKLKGYKQFVIPDITKIIYKCCVCGNNIQKPNVYCSESCKQLHLNQKVIETSMLTKPSKELLEEHLKRMNFSTIAEKYGVKYYTVANWVRSYGIQYDHHQIKHIGRSVKLDLDKVKKLMVGGYNYSQIASVLNTTKNIIDNNVRRRNLREEVFGHDRSKWPVNNYKGGDMSKIQEYLN